MRDVRERETLKLTQASAWAGGSVELLLSEWEAEREVGFVRETRSLVWGILHFGLAIRRNNSGAGRQLVFRREVKFGYH